MSQCLTYRGTAGRARVAVDSSGRAGKKAQEVLLLRKPQTALTRVNGVTKASYSAFHRLIPAILAFHSALIVRFSPAAFERAGVVFLSAGDVQSGAIGVRLRG
jgi:hypothetical protein